VTWLLNSTPAQGSGCGLLNAVHFTGAENVNLPSTSPDGAFTSVSARRRLKQFFDPQTHNTPCLKNPSPLACYILK